MNKYFEIKREPIIKNDVEIVKYNIYYYHNSDLVDAQFHSYDGVVNGSEHEGYKNKNAPNWLGVEQALYYSGLRQKAKEDPNIDLFEFASLIGAFGNGKEGKASQETLLYLLRAINVSWSEQDVAQINQILENNNFTIRLT